MHNKSERMLSLDVFRGLTMALMVLVNAQGSGLIYPVLGHAAWNGCTLADLVFPFFLFIVGLTTVISLKKQMKMYPLQSLASRSNMYGLILKRSGLLFLFGLLLNAFPSHFDFASIRVYGILQRIALCYLICSIIYLNTTVKTQIILFWGILLSYWFFMTQIPLPGFKEISLNSTHNWIIYIDRMLLSPEHLRGSFDPEGLISTLSAVATTLLGLITASFLQISIRKQKKCFLMILAGLIFLLLGWLWSYNFPINKLIWSSTFVLWTGGVALIVFALCFYIIDLQGYTLWALPFKILGVNALFIFIFHVLLLKIQWMYVLPLKNGTSENLKALITNYLFAGFSPENAALLYAVVFLFFNFLVAYFLYRRKIFFKL